MRQVPPPGWQFPWPGRFQDKRFHLNDGAVIYAWPSTGGRLELQNPSAFELDVLGIEDHSTESNKSADAAEEDAFALKLRHLGGTFAKYQYGFRTGEDLYGELHTWLGWPEEDEHKGGVWVLKVTRTEASDRQTGRIRLATSMQDRCRAIELCGGVYYASPTEEHLVPTDPVPHSCGRDAQEHDGLHQQALLFES